MSYSAKNYTEQGGDRTVIGGDVSFEEGARITGFPTPVVIDFKGFNFLNALNENVDVTDIIPVETFREASRCAGPIIIRGLSFLDFEVGVQGMATMTDRGIYAMAPYNGNYGASLIGILTLLLYLDEDKVWVSTSAFIPFDDEYVTGVSVSPDYATLDIGETAEIWANVEPGTAVNRNVRWVSSDESVVSLDISEYELRDDYTPVIATAVGAGTATVTATTDDGGYTAYCEVTVNEPEPGPDPDPELDPEPEV